MAALDAYFGVEEWVYSAPTDQPGRLNEFFGVEEWVYDPASSAPARLNAYFGVEEYTGGAIVTPARAGYAYAYEYSTMPPAVSRSGFAYAYEYSLIAPVASRSGYAYANENTVTQVHPDDEFIYDGTAWVPVQKYQWNGTTWQLVS